MNRKCEILAITIDCILAEILLNEKEFVSDKESVLIYEDAVLLASAILNAFPLFLSEEPNRTALHDCISETLVAIQSTPDNKLTLVEKQANAERHTISIVNTLCDVLPRIQERKHTVKKYNA